MYMTAQRKLLFRYFSEHPDVSVTARQLCDVLNNGDQVKIGLSSIYRNLAALTKAGFILQTISQDSKEAVMCLRKPAAIVCILPAFGVERPSI